MQTENLIKRSYSNNNLAECEACSFYYCDGTVYKRFHVVIKPQHASRTSKSRRLQGSIFTSCSFRLSQSRLQVEKQKNMCANHNEKHNTLLLTSFMSCLLETNVLLLEHSGNNGHHCEESSSKCVCFSDINLSSYLNIIPFQSQI